MLWKVEALRQGYVSIYANFEGNNMKHTIHDGFEIYREDPPKKVNHGIDWQHRIDFIKDLRKPGVWYVIGHFEGLRARQAKCRLTRLFDDMEFTSHIDKTGNSKLYARVPPK